MKYSIDGIKDGHVIESISETLETIMVSYLDGTQDIIEKNQETKERILSIMEVHAEEYIHNKGEKVKTLKKKRIYGWFFALIIMIISCGFGILPVFISLALTVLGISLAAVNDFKVEKQINDLDKYELYLKEIRNIVGEYEKIKSKEIEVRPGKSIEIIKNQKTLNNIASLDSYSLEELKEIKDKVERYHILTGEKEPIIEKKEIKVKKLKKEANKNFTNNEK